MGWFCPSSLQQHFTYYVFIDNVYSPMGFQGKMTDYIFLLPVANYAK